MAQVPYSPVPNVTPSGAGLPTVSPNIPAAAFGGDIATAISGMGKEIAGAGNEVYERAIWLQNLNNQAEAKKADADYIVRSGQLHAEFNTLEGDQAIKAYPSYTAKLRALRESIKGSLGNRMSQQMFDSESLGTLSRSIFNAAGHVAGQQKAYVISAADADVTARRERTAANPNDEAGFNTDLAKSNDTIERIGKLRGKPPEAITNDKLANTSAMWATKIEGVAKEAPLQAPKLLEDNRSKLTERDFKRVENVVNNQRDAVGSANIAQDILKSHMDDEGNLTAPMAEIQAKARGLAAQFSPEDPQFITKTIRALDAEYNQRKYAMKQERFDNIQAVTDAFVTHGVSNMQQLLANPKASAAYYALPPSEQAKVPAKIDNYIKARDRNANERTMTELMGMKNNDVEGFLNANPEDPEFKLSQSQIREVMVQQQKVKKQTAQDPRVDRAMGWMRGGFGAQMEAMGVFRRTTSNKTEYDHLTGAVQQALDIWQEDHKKPPTNKEFNEQIAPNILKVQKEPGAFGIYGYGVFGNDRTIYRHDTGSKDYQTFVSTQKADITAKGGAEPSEEELYKSYTRLQLLKLYPAKKKGEVK